MPVTKEVKMTFKCDVCTSTMEVVRPTIKECERHARYYGWTFNSKVIGNSPFCSCPSCSTGRREKSKVPRESSNQKRFIS